MKTLIRLWIAREWAFLAYLYSDIRYGGCPPTSDALTHFHFYRALYSIHRDWLRNRKAAME